MDKKGKLLARKKVRADANAKNTAREMVGDGQQPNKYWVSTNTDFYVTTLENPGVADWASDVEALNFTPSEEGETFGPYNTFPEALDKFEELYSQIGSEPVDEGINGVYIEDRISGIIYEGSLFGVENRFGYSFDSEVHDDTDFTSSTLGFDIKKGNPGSGLTSSKKKASGDPNDFNAEEVAESYINGNISWVRDEIAGNLDKFVAVQEALKDMGEDMAMFNRRMTASKKKADTEKTAVENEVPEDVKARLEYLRGEIEAERISYEEIAELESLVDYIDSDDVQLLEWAGMPEDEYRERNKESSKKRASGTLSRGFVEDTIDPHIQDIFREIQHELGITYGEITPMQTVALDDIQEKLINFFLEMYANPEAYKPYYSQGSRKKAGRETVADYQGWENYETWAVALWIDNDGALYEDIRNKISELEGDLTPVDSSSYSAGVVELADYLNNMLEENNPLKDTSDVYSDLLQGAVSEVDFREIAEHKISSFMDDKEYNNKEGADA